MPRNKPKGPKPAEQAPSKSPLQSYFLAPLRTDLLVELQMIFLSFITGIQDAATYVDYHAFASNQTGNTVLLAVAVAGIERDSSLFIPRNIGVSLGSFTVSVWVFGQLGGMVGPRKRAWVLASNFVQTVLVFVAAALQYVYGVRLQSGVSLGIIALLSVAAGGQIVLSRNLGINEIPTAIATSAWVDLLSDKRLFAWDNRGRNRRVAFLLALVAGSFCGAYMYSRVDSAFTLMMSAVGKAIVTMSFCCNLSVESNPPRQKSGEKGDAKVVNGK